MAKRETRAFDATESDTISFGSRLVIYLKYCLNNVQIFHGTASMMGKIYSMICCSGTAHLSTAGATFSCWQAHLALQSTPLNTHNKSTAMAKADSFIDGWFQQRPAAVASRTFGSDSCFTTSKADCSFLPRLSRRKSFAHTRYTARRNAKSRPPASASPSSTPELTARKKFSCVALIWMRGHTILSHAVASPALKPYPCIKCRAQSVAACPLLPSLITTTPRSPHLRTV